MKFQFEVQVDGYRFDAVGHEAGIVVSVEFRRHMGTVNADWWISGLNKSEALVVLARVSLGHGEMTESEARDALPGTFEKLIKPMLKAFKESGGLTAVTNAPAVKTKQALCKLHLNEHEIEGTIGGELGIRVSTARQYQLIKSFGLKAARPMIAEREGLPISTISRRLYLAREDGILQKMSDVDDIKN